MSAFVWLDYSERERRKMLDVVDLFREHDTRDELGVGSVRDAFAGMLFPGTSTIMTRARYFLLVPWTYQKLERSRVKSAEIATRARRAELDIVELIERSDDSDGNIGKVAKTTLKRLPSSVYWQGLSVWGIRSFRGAQVQYHRSLDRYCAQLMRHSGRVSERDVEHDDLISPNWHAGLVSPPEDFPAECSLSLTRREAEYLAERIRLSPACSGSLLAELISRRRPVGDTGFAWELPQCADLPPKLREMLEHARNFSEIMYGAPLLYNLILAEQAREKDRVAKYRRAFAEWARSLSKRARPLAQWKRERFWELVRSVNPRITGPTQEFINTWWDLALAGDAARLCDSSTARLLIRDREGRLNKTLARIDNPRAQELWTGDAGTAQLEFRWNIGRRHGDGRVHPYSLGRAGETEGLKEVNNMDWFWNWGGECFGYRDGDSLFTYFGKEIGRFDGEEVYGSNARYLSEVMNDNRMITSRSKKSWVRGSFGPGTGGSYARYANYVGYAMYAGYEDFPAPDSFR